MPFWKTLVRGLKQFCGDSTKDELLLLGARPHAAFQEWKHITGWQPLKPLADSWETAGFSTSDEIPEGKWPVVACLPGKSKEETLFLFALARARVKPGGTLICALANESGAGRFEKQLAKATGRIESLSKHKCRAFWACDDGTWNDECFAEWQQLGEARAIEGTHFHTVPGVFSAGRIDAGSQFLVDHLPGDLRGTIADLGAGWGFLSDSLLSRFPTVTQVDLFEADSRALSCARRNLAQLRQPCDFPLARCHPPHCPPL